MTSSEKQEILSAIKAESQNVADLPSVTSLTGITSLPAVKDGELVSAPISLLSKPAEDAATIATTAASAATTAASAADKAASAAMSAENDAATAAVQAFAALEQLDGKADELQAAADSAKSLAQGAADSAAAAQVSAQNAAASAADAKDAVATATSEASEAKDLATAAKSTSTAAAADASAALAMAKAVKTTAEAAQDDAATALTSASAAKTSAASAASDASEALVTAKAAKTSAQAAQEDVASATSEASEAKDLATAAKSTSAAAAADASAALSMAKAVKATAEAAQDDAATALTSASVAKTSAASAASDASEALVTAKAAKTSAQTAQEDVASAKAMATSAKTTAADALSGVEKAEAAASDASASASAASASASAAAASAASASDKADTAAAKADAASDKADAAAAKADAASEKADAADTKAEEAKADAASSLTFASAARTDAAEAKAAASKAQDTADTAQTAADTAQASALTAQEMAKNGGGGFYNVTAKHPLSSGFYTKETAVAALASADISEEKKMGLIITFEKAAGEWADYRFIGTDVSSFLQAGAWDEYGGGKVRSVSVDGKALAPDSAGNVDIAIEHVEVDSSLDTDSTNPVENRIVAQKLAEVEAHTLGSMEVVTEGDDSYLYAYGLKGETIAQTKLPAGGGGGGTVSTSRIVISAKASASMVKEGGECSLSYSYDHVNADGETDGVKATITVTVKLGTTTLYTAETRSVAAGTYSLSLTPYMKTAGKVDVYVKAECTTEEGEQQTKQAYAGVTVAALSLTSAYDVSTGISKGGYRDGETIELPFTLTGSGSRTVSMYLDGSDVPVVKTVTKAGTTRDSFMIKADSLSAGRHSAQIVAEREGLRSDTLWIDVVKAAASPQAAVALMATVKSGQIVTGKMPLTLSMEARQYDKMALSFAAYDPEGTPATVKEVRTLGDKTEQGTLSVGRGKQSYSCRFMEQGEATVALSCGDASALVSVEVQSSGIGVAEATLGLQLKLSANGRSNQESNPAEWSSNGVQTVFEGVDWATSGWDGTALVLRNGAKAVVGYRPFADDAKASGATVEVEMMVKGVSDHEALAVACIDGGKGIKVTTDTAALYSGSTIDREDEENTDPDTGLPMVSKVPVGVESSYAEGVRVRMAMVIRTKADGKLMELYMNGDRCGAMCYQDDDNFKQDAPQGITLSSDGADLYVYSIRAYSRALEDDEVVDNYIVGQDTADEMAALYEQNSVMSEETGEIDINTILAKGKAAIFIVRSEDSGDGLDDVNACKNKKQNFHVDELTVHTAWGDTIRATNVMMRIQGTSSTKYPVKNYRFYWAKTAKEGLTPEMWLNGERLVKNKMPLFKDDKHACKVSCAKADFSDSSMKTNTGMACLFNDVLKDLCPTPPQEEDGTVRSAIYGYPCDIFAATSADEAHPKYYGQYQMNNDKSDWYEVTGMTDRERHIALEFLDNGKPLCCFQAAEDIDKQMEEEFDSSFEFNYPKDTFWQGADEAAGEANASDYQKTAVKSMLSWVRSCVPAGADMTCADLSTWKSEAFRQGVEEHFSLRNLLFWYLLTEYFAMVDQRAKNTIWRTWDGSRWYVTYYDGDTMLGKRNDSLLAYLYNVARSSWDAEKKKWVFEGHDSWLWCLLLANFDAELRSAAEELRRSLTNNKVLSALDAIEQNWSRREYNKSGWMKYIRPETEGVRVTENGVTTDGNRFYYMYALSGTRSMQMNHFITRRFALLDARMGVSTYRADSAGFYMAREASDPADTIRITSADEYYFAYGLSGKDYMEGETGCLLRGETGTLSVTGKRALNDPMLLFGASRILELDLTGASAHLLNGLELGSCSALRSLDVSVPEGGEASKTSWWLVTDGCQQLQSIDLHGQTGARSNRQDSTALDFSSLTMLRSLDVRGTRVKSVLVADGAPLTSLRLPASLTSLRLSHLAKLTTEGLTMEGCDSVETFVFSSCPLLDWQALLGKCTNVKRIRVAGIDMDGDGALLDKYMEAGGVDENGNYTDTCAFVGSYRLTRFVDDETYAAYAVRYPELNITQPEYTTIKFDDSVSDSANISNLDNDTGYDYDKAFVMSGHVAKICARRHRVLMKRTGSGEVTICQLHDKNSNYFADADDVLKATAAKLTGEMGDVMMYEPHYWYKGVNDYLNKTKYALYSVNDKCPTVAEHKKIEFADLTVKEGYGVRANADYATLAEAEAAMSSDSYCTVNVQGYKQVRYPSLPSALYGAVLLDADGKVVKRMKVTSDSGIMAGHYCFTSIPDDAVTLAFTIATAAPFDYVLLTKSDKIEAIEPDWVEHEECLCGVYEALLRDDFMYSISGVQSSASITCPDFKVYARNRGTGFQLVDYEMHKDVGNLFFAKYGERDSQGTCGPGTHTNGRATGASDATGMQDTKATAKDGDTPPAVSNGYYQDGNAYVLKNEEDEQRTAIGSPVCMGYENWYGNKAEWMEVDFNRKTVDYIWRSPMPDGTEREIQGPKQQGDLYPKNVIHGRYMDTIASQAGGSQTSYYYDSCCQSGSTARVVFRSYFNAYAVGGVSYASASYDSAYVGAFFGSRLAFRGHIKIATSVAEFIAIKAVA